MTDVDHFLTGIEFFDDFEVREEALKELYKQIESSPVDVRQPLLGFAPSADEHQLQVVECRADTIRVVAPAGSGKTQTMLNRVIRRVQQGISPHRILVLTFDNAAVSSLRTKLQHQLDELGAALDGLRIQTLNAYGYNFLQRSVPHEYHPVIEGSYALRLVKDALRFMQENYLAHYNTLPHDILPRFYLDFFSLLKNELFDPRNFDHQRFADFMQSAPQSQRAFFRSRPGVDEARKIVQTVGMLFKGYEAGLRKYRKIDFDDQKLRTYVSLRDSANLRNVTQGSFAEIIVDEFQDINRLDFVLIKMLAERSTLIVTGDDDQAIYGFRGCKPDFIINLAAHLGRNVTEYELQRNYRNPPNLIRHAGSLIARNANRISKSPIPVLTTESSIKVASTGSAGIEARSVIKFIEKVRRANNELRYSDFSVLYRTNAQSLPFQVEFILNGVPFFVRDEDNILENEMLERLLAVLKLKLHVKENAPLSSRDAVLAIESYFRFVHPQVLNSLEPLFRNAPNFFDVLESGAFAGAAPSWMKNSNVSSFLRKATNAHTLVRTLDILAEDFAGLRGMIGSLEDVAEERVPLGEVYELAANYRGNLQKFVETVSYAIDQARQTNAGKDRDGVSLLTYFKAKGLQWHTVILSSCNEGLIPHKKAPLEDERRLFYVAMTRASSNLFVSYVKKLCRNDVTPSRFIAEAGLN